MSKTLSISFAVSPRCEVQWLEIVKEKLVPELVKSGLVDNMSVFLVPTMDTDSDVSSYNIQLHFENFEHMKSFREKNENIMDEIFSVFGQDVLSFRMELTKIIEIKCK